MKKVFNAACYLVAILTLSSHVHGYEQEDENSEETEIISNEGVRARSRAPKDVLVRRIESLYFSPAQTNFMFNKFTTVWVHSEKDWDKLWKQNRVTYPTPEIPIDWEKESVLAVFWPSVDDVVRFTSFLHSEELAQQNSSAKTLRLTFQLMSVCFGIITDQSPAQFVIVGKNFEDIDSISVQTMATQQTNCF